MPVQVSIIIPALNAGEFIDRAIKSALSQTLREIEIIVVDDSSSDNTCEVVKAFCKHDRRVILQQNNVSKGVSAARNAAMAQCVGTWIAPLDADDEFAPGRLATMVRAAEERSLDVLADNLNVIDFSTRRHLGLAFPVEWMTTEEPISFDCLLERDTPGKYSCRGFGFVKPIIRRSFMQANALAYAEDIWLGEDFLLYAELLLSNARFGVMGDALYTYSFRDASASNRKNGTPQLIEVNQRIARKFRDSISGSGGTGHRRKKASGHVLKTREQALRYEHFLKYAKDGRLLRAAGLALRVSPSYFAKRLAATIGRRISDNLR